MNDFEVEFKISHRAYSKMMLHIIKHLKNDCYGVLVGKVNSIKNNEKVKETVEVIDTYALSHDKVFIPQLELCLKMIEKKLQGTNYHILGFYENLMFNFDKEEPKPSHSSYFMCDGIKSVKNLTSPYLLEISHSVDTLSKDGKRGKDAIYYQILRYDNSNFDFCMNFQEDKDMFKVVKTLLSRYTQNEISDFDDHLLDTKQDFSNEFIDGMIEKILASNN